MKPPSVIVDRAAESGGNCALTRTDETVTAHGVVIMGPANLPAQIPVHASQMYSKNVVTLLKEMVSEEGELELDFENDVIGPATVTHGGEIRSDRVRSLVEGASA
jgi:NAD(P) transhydrogenase subunit alpha